jgi:diacylglycerol kinase family enzyme
MNLAPSETAPQIKTAIALVNRRSGSVGEQAPEQMEALLRERGAEPTVLTPEPDDIPAAVADGLASDADIFIVLGGDGTARCVASEATVKSPPLMLLPGGTMNLLPKKLYGERNWQDALVAALEEGRVRYLPGASANGEQFFCAAIFGTPALFATARESVREGKLMDAMHRVRFAFGRAFAKRLRVRTDGDIYRRSEAVAVMPPLTSQIEGTNMLEAALLDPAGFVSAFRLGVGALTGGWRKDPAADLRESR